MKDWHRMIRGFYARNGVTGDPWFGPPATAEALAECEAAMGVRFTGEFRSLYRAIDGTNDTAAQDPDSRFGFVPIDRLPAFMESVRASFRDEHPAEARRFHPFFDGSDRGGLHVIGFMASGDGGLDPELFLYWRGGDDGKKVFLLPCEHSIESFLLGDGG